MRIVGSYITLLERLANDILCGINPGRPPVSSRSRARRPEEGSSQSVGIVLGWLRCSL